MGTSASSMSRVRSILNQSLPPARDAEGMAAKEVRTKATYKSMVPCTRYKVYRSAHIRLVRTPVE